MEHSTQNVGVVGATSANDQYFALRSLGIDDQQLNILRTQGYLDRDRRWPAYAGYWKLRFRQHKSLHTIYLGNDAKLAGRVLHELSMLRSAHRRRRELQRAVQEGRQLLRQVKQRLTLLPPEFGVHFHGDSLRKSRRRNPNFNFPSS